MEKYNLTQTGQEVQNILDNAIPQLDLAEEVERAQEAERLLGEGIQQNATDIDAIEGKIPSAATSENKLTDKEYVDDLVDDEKNRAQDAEQQNADDIDAIKAIIPSNATSENKLATSNDVDTVAQSVGTEETRAKAAEKQNADDIDAIESMIPLDATSENKLATVSDITTEATTRENADAALQSAIEAILLLIPSAASSLNQLADKAFVNSSIATNTATFRGTFNLVNDLHLTLAATHSQVGNALALAILDSDNNDYCYVQIPTVETAPNEIAQTDRYKFNGTSWEYEYTLNNSGFTSAQWTAINSGITSVLVSKLSELPTNSELITDLGTLTSAITAINQKIPAAAAQNNKLVDTAALESYIVQVLGVLTVSYNITSTDGHVTLAIQQTDGKITSVALTTSDIASAAALNLKASQADLTALANRVTTAEGNITTLAGRVSTNETDIAQLQAAYDALTQSDIIIGALPASGVANKIYRVPGTSSYSDYMWNGTQFVLMATYNNAIDPRPKKASQNLVTSGGVFDNMGALDISELNATENPHTIATYADLSAALAAIPSNDYKKGGMSIKFVQTDDNKYVRYNLLTDSFTTDVTKWAIDDAGVYVDNPEFVYVKTDAEGKILWAIKANGSIYYGAGVPQQVIDYINEKLEELSIDEYEDIVAFLNDLEKGDKTLHDLLNEKVDKEEGKTLIDSEYASTKSIIKNPEFFEVTTDSEDKVLEGIQQDGTKVIGGDLQVNGNIINDGIQSQIDAAIEELQEEVSEMLGKSSEKLSYFESVDNPEWNKVTTDAEGKILEGITSEGKKKVMIETEIQGFLDLQPGDGGSSLIGAGNGGSGKYGTVAVGNNNLPNATGTKNTTVGNDNMSANGTGLIPTGSRNVSMGYHSLFRLTSGNDNAGFGAEAGDDNTSGSRNTAVGAYALQRNTRGNNNVAIGYFALKGNPNVYTEGYKTEDCIAIGKQALQDATSGMDNNIAIGSCAMQHDTTHKNCIVIGKDANATEDGQIVLGTANQTEIIVLGNKKLIFNGDGTVSWEAI